MRIMAIDYGDAHTGLAVSDATGLLAGHVEVVHTRRLPEVLAAVERLAGEYGVEELILGLPKHMNGEIGERAEYAIRFAEMLKRRTGLPVKLWDERLSSVSAERVLIENKVRRENRKKYMDKLAAVFILQSYLDSLQVHL